MRKHFKAVLLVLSLVTCLSFFGPLKRGLTALSSRPDEITIVLHKPEVTVQKASNKGGDELPFLDEL